MKIKIVHEDVQKKRGWVHVGYIFADVKPSRVTPSVKASIEDSLMNRYGLDPDEWMVQKHYVGHHFYYEGQPGRFINFVRG